MGIGMFLYALAYAKQKILSGAKVELCYNVVVRINLVPAPDPS